MRTKFTTVLTAIVAVIVLTFTAQKSSAAEGIQLSTKLTEIKNISKITASGNVEVFLTQGGTEGVTVYDNYYGKYALVQLQDGELRISSYGTKTLQVWVQVDGLKSIEANGTAKIQSLNKISAPDLSIELSDSAVAVLHAETLASKANVNESASLSLTGSSENYSLSISGTGKVDATNFKAGEGSLKVTDNGQLVISRDGKNVLIQSTEKA